MNGPVMDADRVYTDRCAGWLIAARHAIDLVTLPPSIYRDEAAEIITSTKGAYARPQDGVGALTELLSRLLADLNGGLLASIKNRVSAETFDDFLDHAQAYLNENRKDPAGVIGGVVFEDTIRRICRKHGITEAGVQLDSLINALKVQGVLSKLEAKSAVASASLRTSATHAKWSEFKFADVEPAIDFTRRLIREHLDS